MQPGPGSDIQPGYRPRPIATISLSPPLRKVLGFGDCTRGALMQRRQFLKIASAVAGYVVLTHAGSAKAQSLAGKQVRVIVPFPAGGPTDIVARPLAQMLGDALKSIIVIDNRGGAGGSIGAEAVARSNPDGQTLLVGTVGTQAINSALYPKLPYDPVRDFTPIALV